MKPTSANGKQILNNKLSTKKLNKNVDKTKLMPPPVTVGFSCILLELGLSRKKFFDIFTKKYVKK